MLRVTSLASETFSDSSVSNGLAWDSLEVRLLAGGRPMLEARGLTKYYGSVLAVQSIDFSLEPGQVLGYLGPNGSGKSTTVKMLIGLLEPTDGQVLFNGKNIQQDLVGYRKHLGYVPEEANLYPYLTGYEYLELIGTLRGMPPARMRAKIDSFLELFSLFPHRHISLSSYSRNAPAHPAHLCTDGQSRRFDSGRTALRPRRNLR